MTGEDGQHPNPPTPIHIHFAKGKGINIKTIIYKGAKHT